MGASPRRKLPFMGTSPRRKLPFMGTSPSPHACRRPAAIPSPLRSPRPSRSCQIWGARPSRSCQIWGA
eukprot:4316845-Prymnesium_polylepis.1